MRVISLLAGATEMVTALGAGECLVGRSHECDTPPWVNSLPACTRAAFDANVASAAIDAEVRRRLKTGEPLYHVDTDLIRHLKPDLLIAQAHCEVCAVTPRDIEGLAGDVLCPRVLALSAGTVEGILGDVMNVAKALQRPQAGADLVTQMQRRMKAVKTAVRNKPAPTVVMLEWMEPLFSMGNWGPELLEAANGIGLLSERGAYSRSINWHDVQEADPDYLIVAPCGFDLDRTKRELPSLERLSGWRHLKAVQAGRVVIADGNRYFNRSGPSIVETVEILAEILHGHRVTTSSPRNAWEAYS